MTKQAIPMLNDTDFVPPAGPDAEVARTYELTTLELDLIAGGGFSRLRVDVLVKNEL